MNLNCESNRQPPVVFIGIDGAEPGLLRQWADAGWLPHLARLLGSSRHGPVRTLPGMGDGANWPTLLTGCSPARHGRYFRIQQQSGSYAPFEFDSAVDLKAHPFWLELDQAGLAVEILDLPYGRAEPLELGRVIADWHIHDRYAPALSHPPEWIREVKTNYGDDPVGGNSDQFSTDAAGVRKLQNLLIERIANKRKLVVEHLARSKARFIGIGFAEMHDIGHMAWHMHDPLAQDHDPAFVAANGDPLLNVMKAVDDAIGHCLQAMPEDATVVVFTGLGMGPDWTANKLLHAILARTEGRVGDWQPGFRLALQKLTRQPLLLRAAGKIDWILLQWQRRHSRFFEIGHNENSGAIRLNLRGREPAGRIEPEDYDRVCDELEKAFLDLRNPVNGLPIVEQVVRVHSEPDFQGPCRHDLPDLLVIWHRAAPFDAVISERTGRINGASSWGRSGDHTSNAHLLVRRAGLAAGDLGELPRMVDIAPTLAWLCGHVLKETDGRPILEVCG